MKLRALTDYRTRDGKRRRIRLYKAWRNMQERCSGTGHAGNGNRAWLGVEIEFKDFAEFRVWSLANGYSAYNNSLDRYPDPYGAYGPTNCRWITRGENTAWRNICYFLREKEAHHDESDPYPQVGRMRNRQRSPRRAVVDSRPDASIPF